MVLSLHFKMLFNICLLCEVRFQFKILRCLILVLSLKVFVLNIHLIDTKLVVRPHFLHFNIHVFDHGIFFTSHRFELNIVLFNISSILFVDTSQCLFVVQLLLHVLIPQFLSLS